MADRIDILFNGSKEILKVVGRGDPLVAPLLKPNTTLCPLIGAEIKFHKELGKGNWGTVFEITMPGKGTKKYAVKRGNLKTKTFDFSASPLVSDDDERIKYVATLDIIRAFNPGVDLGNAAMLKNIKIPVNNNTAISECVIREPLKYKAVPYKAGGVVTIPTNSYVCSNESYSEYYISALLGESYRKEECIHFFDVYSMFVCTNPDQNSPVPYYQYIFMDKIDATLVDIRQCLSINDYLSSHESSKSGDEFTIDTIRDGIFAQTMFAIAFYQTKYKVSHNDLHEGNVFVEYVKKSDPQKGITGTTFNGEYLSEVEWYHYRIGNIDLYFPAIPVIVKIGDFGLSVKYSHPLVGFKKILEDGYPVESVTPGWGAWQSNHFIPQYDSVYYTTCYTDLLQNFKMSDLFYNSFKFLIPSLKSNNHHGRALRILKDEKMVNGMCRPNLEMLSNCGTAYNLLTSNIFQKYRTKPTSGKIVTLGVI